MLPMLEKPERPTELPSQSLGRVTANIEAATPERAFEGEGREDGASALAQCPLHDLHIANPVGGIGQEMKDRAIVPHITRSFGLVAGDVAGNPANCLSPRPKSSPRSVESGRRDIEYREVLVSEIEQGIDEE